MRPLVLALFAVLACAAPPSSVADPQALSGSDVRLRIVAGNLTSGNNQNYDSGEGLRIFEGVHPDVVMVQEFNLTSGDFQGFANSICGQTCYFSRETLSGNGNLPNGVVSKYPIKSSGRFVDSSVSNRGYEWAQIDIPGTKDLWVFSLHLLTNTSAHASEGAELVADIQGLVPAGDWIVIGGDLNSSSSDAAISAFSSVVVTSAASPVDQSGNANTNGPRSKHYDWVFASSGLNALEVPVSMPGGQTFSAGLVVDTRVYTPMTDLAPALATDSAATNMQHMAVVKDFLIPGDTGGSGASITVTAPNGGESFAAGSTQNITWSSSGVTNVKVEYSADGGSTYSTVVASTAAAAGTYAWTVPSSATTNGKVRVSDTGTSGASDTSNTAFTVVAAPPGSDAFEPDDTAAAAKAIALGTPQTHSILPATDQDWMSFTLAAPTNVRIETTGPFGGDTYLYLYNSAQTLIASDDDSGAGYYSLLKRPSLAAGTYYLKVTSYAGHTTISNYSISVASY